jgi:hypothetical protein
VLGESSRLAIFDGRFEEAEAEGAVALELATRFGLEEQRAMILTNAALVKFMDGDLVGADDLNEQAAAIAPAGSHPLFRALANLAVVAWSEGDIERWRVRQARAVEAATRAGDRGNLLWLEAQGIEEAVEQGRWDEALRRIDAFVASGPHYRAHSLLLLKAYVLASRGAVAEATALRDGALAEIEGAEAAQISIPGLLMSAWVSMLAGDETRARQLVASAEPVVVKGRHRVPGVSAPIAVTVARVGRAEAWLHHHRRMVDTRRTRAARLMWTGELVEGADAWAAISPYDEAVARLHAAEVLAARGHSGDAQVQMERGLAFFRAVGATRVVQQGEALLAPAAAAE